MRWKDVESTLFGARVLNFMLGVLVWLVFVFLVLFLLKGMYLFLIATPNNEKVDMAIMLENVYLGLPAVFWILVGIGLLFGMTFHGFRLVSFNYERRK